MGSVTLTKRGINWQGSENMYGGPDFSTQTKSTMNNHKHLIFAKHTLCYDSVDLVIKSSHKISSVSRPVTGLIHINVGVVTQQSTAVIVSAKETVDTVGSGTNDAAMGALIGNFGNFFEVATRDSSAMRNCKDINVAIIRRTT